MTCWKRESVYVLVEAEEVGDERKRLERETGDGKWGNGTSCIDLKV